MGINRLLNYKGTRSSLCRYHCGPHGNAVLGNAITTMQSDVGDLWREQHGMQELVRNPMVVYQNVVLIRTIRTPFG